MCNAKRYVTNAVIYRLCEEKWRKYSRFAIGYHGEIYFGLGGGSDRHESGETIPFSRGGELEALVSVSSAASGIVAQYLLRTCLKAGRRKGLARNPSMPESMHSLTLLSSAKAVRATIGAE